LPCLLETGVCPAAGKSHRREVNQCESSSSVAEIIKTPKTRSRIGDLGNWTFLDALDWLKREQSGYRYSTITYAEWMDFLVQLWAGQIATRLARQGSRQRVLFVKEFASTPRLRNLSQIIRPRSGRVDDKGNKRWRGEASRHPRLARPWASNLIPSPLVMIKASPMVLGLRLF
jgi:hypothetical protein